MCQSCKYGDDYPMSRLEEAIERGYDPSDRYDDFDPFAEREDYYEDNDWLDELSDDAARTNESDLDEVALRELDERNARDQSDPPQPPAWMLADFAALNALNGASAR